uniref:Glyco_hydro_38C domain-containing protein n=2 Tax=Macrostomum lignano TaxID=282301 RepID=A0A1I8GT97_9PLAT
LDLDSLDSSGKVFIYVNTDVPNKEKEVFAGPYETMYGSTRRNVLASSKKEVEYQLLGGAVIVYSSDVSAKHSGFDFEFNIADPESVIIDLKQPQFASVTGAVQFRAISRLACPSVKHRCELQTTDGKSITAQLIKKNITEPTEPQCLSLVTSQFVAVAQPSVITGAVIRCRLFDGSFERLKLPQQTTSKYLFANFL